MAARGMTADMLTAIAAATFRPLAFYEGDFYASGSPDSEMLRLWSGVGPITWDGKIWTGAGQALSIKPIEESNDVRAIGWEVTMSGLPSANVSRALQNGRQGRAGRLWLGASDAAGAIIADPYLLSSGKFDFFVLEDDGSTATIGAKYESRLIDLERARERRYTHADQQIDFPGDLGFEYVNSLQDKQLIWGGPGAAASAVAMPTWGASGDDGGPSGSD
jgi:hypothetical protein